jgi:lysozyme
MRARYAVATALAAAIAGGALFSLTERFEGTGPVEVIPVVDARARTKEVFLDFVTAHEVAVTHAYPDPGYGWGLPTICYGHTKGVKKGDVATLEQCRAWLAEDYERLVLPALSRCVKVPLAINEAAALGSFTFNVGGAAACGSSLVKKLNAGDYAGAAAQFPRWNRSNGVVLRGLVTRRAAEKELFLTEESK